MGTITTNAPGAALESQAAEIVQRLGGTWRRQGTMCRCPAHEDSDPSLSVRLGHSTILFHCFAGCDSVNVIRAIRDQGVLRDGYVASRPAQEVTGASAEWRAAKAREIWDAARPLRGSPAERYLQQRGIAGPYHDLRYLARTPCKPRDQLTFRPAMIAAVRDDTGLVAIQRTFLDISTFTKATDLEKAKMALGLPGKGAIRLSPATDILGLAEGLENARAASTLLGIPVWATMGNERFPLVSVPTTVTRLILLPDPDAGGRRAEALAYPAHQRDGLSIETVWPRFADWNAQLLAVLGRTVAPAPAA